MSGTGKFERGTKLTLDLMRLLIIFLLPNVQSRMHVPLIDGLEQISVIYGIFQADNNNFHFKSEWLRYVLWFCNVKKIAKYY